MLNDKRIRRKRRTRNRIQDAKYYINNVECYAKKSGADFARLRDEYIRYTNNALNEAISYLKYLS